MAAQWMEYVIANREQAVEVGNQAQADLRRDFSYQAIGERILQRLLIVAGHSKETPSTPR